MICIKNKKIDNIYLNNDVHSYYILDGGKIT